MVTPAVEELEHTVFSETGSPNVFEGCSFTKRPVPEVSSWKLRRQIRRSSQNPLYLCAALTAYCDSPGYM